MWKLTIVAFVVGMAMLGYSFTLGAYRNPFLYQQQLAGMTYLDDEAFSRLRANSLTAKHKIQDYGITLMAAGAIGLLATRNGKDSLKSPRSRLALILLALALPVLTTAGAGFDIMQSFNRGDFPPWGDAVMIPLLGLPIVFLTLVPWSLYHVGAFWPHRKQQSVPLALAFSREAHWWLLTVSAVTGGLMIYCAALGYWWLALPGAGWLYYYLSLAADQRLDHSVRQAGLSLARSLTD